VSLCSIIISLQSHFPIPNSLSVAQRTLSDVTTDPSAFTTRSSPWDAGFNGEPTNGDRGEKAPAEARANASAAALASPLATILLVYLKEVVCWRRGRSLWWLIEWFCCWRTTDTQRLERPDLALHVTPSDLLCTKTVLTSWACENAAWEWLTSSAFHLFTPHTSNPKARPRPRHRQSVIESRHVDRLVVLLLY
jgi:hypothetical protein